MATEPPPALRYPDEMLAVFIDSNAAATVAGISELVAQLTINADAVPAWAG
ncbi:hypothetical protein [Rhodococcus sp. ACPA1]|uniref:hypothetical protein n=1 Tax=Rhodococcus sp. ACPA1 TaxID=2028572 RepID=UPI001C527986|nr:hypothetical protein [Rhodococcus sp. ACPA1]